MKFTYHHKLKYLSGVFIIVIIFDLGARAGKNEKWLCGEGEERASAGKCREGDAGIGEGEEKNDCAW